MTWCTGFGGAVAIARRLLKGQTVKRLPSMVGWEGMFVVRRMLKERLDICSTRGPEFQTPRNWQRLQYFLPDALLKKIGGKRFTVRRWLHSVPPLERPYQKARRSALRLEPFRPHFDALYLPSSHVDVLARNQAFTLSRDHLEYNVDSDKGVTRSKRKERSRDFLRSKLQSPRLSFTPLQILDTFTADDGRREKQKPNRNDI